MANDPLPLFPLPLVLLPEELLPLHIFEERYKEMIGMCRGENLPFGIVLAEGASHRKTGCTARITEILEEFPDGRMNILTRGEERFKIIRVLEDHSYLTADVEYFSDRAGEPPPADLVERALAALPENSGGEDAHKDPSTLSFLAAAALRLPPRAKQLLLESDSAGERMNILIRMIEEQEQGEPPFESIRQNAATNGHPRR